MKDKIAVLIPDFFWSSIPYDGLPIFYELSKDNDVDLIIFRKDIRLNKKFIGCEKFKFDVNEFNKIKKLKIIETWDDFYKISQDYFMVLSGVHLAPKGSRRPKILDGIKCKFATIDIGGSDSLFVDANYYFLKGLNWIDFLKNQRSHVKMDGKFQAFNTGTPHYYHYSYLNEDIPAANPINKIDFFKKYNLNLDKKIILVMPSNPAAHSDHFFENMALMHKFEIEAQKNGYSILIKTHPTDYLFYESDEQYSGTFNRRMKSGKDYSKKDLDCPQYKFLGEKLQSSVIIESQDHFAAMLYSDKLFNMSGSHVAWETVFTNANSYTKGFEGREYFNGAKYLHPATKFPDSSINVSVNQIEDIFITEIKPNKKLHSFINKENSLKNIANAVEEIVKNDK